MTTLRWGAVLLLLAVAAGAAEAQPSSPRPPTWQVGDRWLRSDGMWDLVRIEDGQYVFSAGPGSEMRFTKTLAFVGGRKGQRGFMIDPPLELRWPLKVGQVATREVRWITPGCVNCERRVTLSVDKYEDVKVPAGTFKAFKVSFESAPPDRARGQLQATNPSHWIASISMWYVPEIQRYVKFETDPGFGNRAAQASGAVLLDIERPAPLKIDIAGISVEAHAQSPTLPFTGKVIADKGVRRVTLTLNGAEVLKVDEPADPAKEVPLSASLTLREGRNVVLVTATDAAGETRQEARSIVYQPLPPPALVEEPAAPESSRQPSVVAAAPPPPAPRALTPPPAGLIDEPPGAAPAPRLAVPGLVDEPPAVEPAPRIAAPPTPVAPEPVKPPVVAAPAPAPAKPPVIAAPEPPKPPVVAAPPPAPVKPPVVAAPAPVKPPAIVAAVPPAPPFEVKIAAPADRARIDQESIALAGFVSGGRGVSQVIVTVNGLEVVRRDEKTPLRALPLNLPLKLREGQNTLVVTATDADGTITQDVRSVEFARPTPLAIGVRYPEDRAKLSEESTVVAAVVTSGKGVAKISVMLNGAPVAQQIEKAPQTSVVVTAPVTLKAGTNAIVISATDAAGATRQEIRTVTFDPPRLIPVPPLPAPAPPARQQWAVVIGVGQYESVAIPRLRYTVPDAEAIYQTLIGPGGFKKDNVLLLTDRAEKKPTLRNIKWALGTFLGRSAQKDDTVMIFFAGHGAPEVDTRGVERDGLAKYLIPADADPDDLYSTALPMDELQTIFGRIEADRVVAFLDACYSGAAGGRTFAAKKTRAGSIDDLFLERLTRSKGRAIVTAARPTEVSIELPELGHGIFTYYLVNGLKGGADLNRDGIIGLQELYEYVEQQVTTKARAVGGNQHPVMKGELEGALPLTKVQR